MTRSFSRAATMRLSTLLCSALIAGLWGGCGGTESSATDSSGDAANASADAAMDDGPLGPGVDGQGPGADGDSVGGEIDGLHGGETSGDTSGDVSADADASIEDAAPPDALGFAELCEWPVPAPLNECGAAWAWELASEAEHLAFGHTGGNGALVAWASGNSVSSQRFDSLGMPTGEIRQFETAQPVSGLAAASSDEMMLLFYSEGTLDEQSPEDVVLSYVPVEDHGGLGKPVQLAENFQLVGDGVATVVGPRVWGLSDETIGGTVYRMVALTLLNHDGTVRTIHTASTADTFRYYDIHASEIRANYPFVNDDDGTVSFYEQSIYLLSCGVPLLPVMVVPDGSKMVATEFWSGVGTWLVRSPDACDGKGGAWFNFIETGPRVSDIRQLAWSPSDKATIGIRQADGLGVVVDESAGTLSFLFFDVAQRLFSEPRAIRVPQEAQALHVAPTDQGWLVLREVLSDGAVQGLEIRAVCDAPPP